MERTEQVRFRNTVPIATGRVIASRSPLTGNVESIILHFPPGCASLVLVRCGVRGNEQLLPEPPGFIALDDATQEFPVKTKIGFGQRIWAEVLNQDPLNPHTPSIIFNLRGKL